MRGGKEEGMVVAGPELLLPATSATSSPKLLVAGDVPDLLLPATSLACCCPLSVAAHCLPRSGFSGPATLASLTSDAPLELATALPC